MPNTLKLDASPNSFASQPSPPLSPPIPSTKKEPPNEETAPPLQSSSTILVPPAVTPTTPSLIENFGLPLNFGDQIKYSNIPVLVLKVGNWQKTTLFCGDIIAKLMYEERKFVWEVYPLSIPIP